MKKQILSIGLGLVIMAIGTTVTAADKKPAGTARLTASEKVVKDFNRQFQNAVNPVIDVSDKGFTVSSAETGNKITSFYNKKGKWVYTIERYATGKFDANIADIVKGDYEAYKIAGMEKIDQSGYNTVYIVHLEDGHTIKTVRVKNDEVELIQDFEKA